MEFHPKVVYTDSSLTRKFDYKFTCFFNIMLW